MKSLERIGGSKGTPTKRQLASVGDALLEIQPEPAEKTAIEPKKTGKL